MSSAEDDRILNRRGRRHFRRSYSVQEVKIGALTGAVLAGVFLWVAWRGASPDPELSKTAADLFDTKTKTPAATDRGPLPKELAPPGFREKNFAVFDETNLYVKIDGREGYYKAFGFQRLYFVSLASEKKEDVYVDLELFDLQKIDNAIGAMSGEVPQEGKPALVDGALVFEGRNSILLASGRHYARLIGADESAEVHAALAYGRDRLLAALPREPMPLGFALFVGALGVPSNRIAYEAENAFSLAIAKDVHIARLADESELFVIAAPDPAEARTLAEKIGAGFKEYGEDAGAFAGISWVRDRYLSTMSGASNEGSYVIGVRGMADKKKAAEELARLRKGVSGLGPTHTAAAAKDSAAKDSATKDSAAKDSAAKDSAAKDSTAKEGEAH